MTRLLVLTEDPVGAEMGGNAIRAYELAKALTAHAAVTLGAPPSSGTVEGVAQVPFDRDDPGGLRRLLGAADVVLTLPTNPVVAGELRRSCVRVIYDLYDPKVLQLLEAHTESAGWLRRYWSTIALDHLLDALDTGDFFVCASERQRDLWIGAMLAHRLLAPAIYKSDPSLRQLIDVVPFGVSDASPNGGHGGLGRRYPGLQGPDEVVLWNGGLWNWLDPVGAVEAISRVAVVRPSARLVFMGRPPLGQGQARAARAAKQRADELGLTGSVVFFNDEWVPYAERGDWLLGADCALSMHHDHLETRFSFRTRLLDCLWAGLPIVCTKGDELARLVECDGLGVCIDPDDHHQAAQAILEVLSRGRTAYGSALAQAAARYTWPRAVSPLVSYLRDLRHGESRRRRKVSARALRTWGVRTIRTIQRAGTAAAGRPR